MTDISIFALKLLCQFLDLKFSQDQSSYIMKMTYFCSCWYCFLDRKLNFLT